MSENISNAEAKKLKQKTLTRRDPLSIINGDVSNRKKNIKKLKQSYKIQKHENFVAYSRLPDEQKFKIFEDNKENKTGDSENDLASSNEISSSSSSPECIGLSPDIEKESLFSYCKKKKEPSDLIWYTPYKQDIYIYFKEAEQNFRPNPKYMEKQLDLNMKMRSILIDWCVEVVEEYKLHSETLYLSISFIDRFLSHISVLRGKLQLVGTASMFLAAKYEEIYPPELKDFVFITDNTYTKQQILRMEHLILKVLNFDVTIPTAFAFLQLYLSMCNASDVLKQLSQYICEMTLLDGDPFLKYLPSVIAAGSLALSNYILGFDMWDENMESSSGYKLTDLYHICHFLYCKLKQMPSCTEKAIYEKYKTSKYGSVSLIPYPDGLIFPDLVKNCSCSYC